MKILKKTNFNLLIVIFSFLACIDIYRVNPVYSFIPSVYEPNFKELKSTSRDIGITAAQLTYLGEVKKAKQLIDLGIQLNPSDDNLWFILVEIEIKNNNLIKARESLNEAIKLNPANANYWFKKGSIDFQEKKINRSIKSISKGLAIDPNNPGGYFQMGNSKFVINKFNEALIAFKKATEIEPKFWQALNNQALVLFELGEKEKAIVLWKKTIRVQNDPEPILALAAAKYKKNENNDDLIISAKEALLRNPNYALISYQKEQLWGERLCQAIQKLFQDPEMSTSIEKAVTKANMKKNHEKDTGPK